jgi:hypothetical protein
MQYPCFHYFKLKLNRKKIYSFYENESWKSLYFISISLLNFLLVPLRNNFAYLEIEI